MKIDLSLGAELPPFLRSEIDEVAKETRHEFTKLISVISDAKNLKNNID